jgi:hypothetical protein
MRRCNKKITDTITNKKRYCRNKIHNNNKYCWKHKSQRGGGGSNKCKAGENDELSCVINNENYICSKFNPPLEKDTYDKYNCTNENGIFDCTLDNNISNAAISYWCILRGHYYTGKNKKRFNH